MWGEELEMKENKKGVTYPEPQVGNVLILNDSCKWQRQVENS